MAGTKGNKKKNKGVSSKKGGGPNPPPAAPSASPATAASAAAVPLPKPVGLSASGGAPPAASRPAVAPAGDFTWKPKATLDPAALLQRAQRLKEEGNRQFTERHFAEALKIYDVALKFVPEGHADRAVLYSNRAACLLQIRPVNYEGVLEECNLALALRESYPRALLRRARAYEALGRVGEAEEDLKLVLQAESSNQDALDLLLKIKAKKETIKVGPAPVNPTPEAPTANGDKSISSSEPSKEVSPIESGGKAEHVEEAEDEQLGGQQQLMLEDWFLELAEMVRMRLGIDPTRADQFEYNFTEINKAIDEAVSTEEAAQLLQLAETKFMSMSAMVLINWASTYRALAQKKSAKKPKAAVEAESIQAKAEGADENRIQGETTANGNVEKVKGELADGAGGVEEGENEDDDLARELADCDWSLKHVEIAMEKYEAALHLQPGMVDAIAGIAHCFAGRAQATERRAELLSLKKGGLPLTRELAVKVKKDYDGAREKFIAAKEVLEKIERDYMEQPKSHHHCTNPDHHHPPAAANGEAAGSEEVAQESQFLDNVANFRLQMFSHWASALSSAAHFEYKLGTSQWKSDLQRAAELKKEVGETEEEVAELKEIEQLPSWGDDKGEKSQWAEVWASGDDSEDKRDVGKAEEKGNAAESDSADLPQQKQAGLMAAVKTEDGVVVAGESEGLSGGDSLQKKEVAAQSNVAAAGAAAAQSGEEAAAPSSQKRASARKFSGGPPPLEVLPKESRRNSVQEDDHVEGKKKFEGDEPMTPVKDLVGKFTSWSNNA